MHLQRIKRILTATAGGTLVGMFLRNIALHMSKGIARAWTAPDDVGDAFLGAAAAAVIEYLLERKYISPNTAKKLALAAIGARAAYEVIETAAGRGVTPISRPTYAGSIKDVITFASAMGLYALEKRISPPNGKEYALIKAARKELIGEKM